MATPGYLKTERFINHSPTSKPSSNIIDSHFSLLVESDITNQIGRAGWFLAVLKDRPGLQGHNGQLYVIFNPMDRDGNAITKNQNNDAKVCCAPCPPFCDGEQASSIEELLLEINVKVNKLIDSNG